MTVFRAGQNTPRSRSCAARIFGKSPPSEPCAPVAGSRRLRNLVQFGQMRRSVRISIVACLGTGVWVAGGSLALAGNGLHPRTPVEFIDPPCMTVVDRSVDSVMHLDYTIPYEDVEVTEDEVHNSRTHQFFALCRDYDVNQLPPTWVTWTDVSEAEAVGLLPPDLTDEDVFETSVAWEGCWHRMNEDADRRPITFAAAAQGVDWDTTGIPAGPYVIRGYTYEPAFNIWWRRTGVVHVVDGPELDGVTPAVAIDPIVDSLTLEDSVEVAGCVRAPEGSMLDAYWARADEDTLNWEPFAMDVPVAGATYSFNYMPTEAALNHSIIFRVDVRDPEGRRFEGHVSSTSFVIQGSSCDSDSGDAGIVVPPGCETTGTATGDPATTGEPTTSGSGESSGTVGTSGQTTTGDPSATTGEVDGGGCACRTGERNAGGALMLFAVIWHTRRRRGTC